MADQSNKMGKNHPGEACWGNVKKLSVIMSDHPIYYNCLVFRVKLRRCADKSQKHVPLVVGPELSGNVFSVLFFFLFLFIFLAIFLA